MSLQVFLDPTVVDDPADRPVVRLLPGRHKRARRGHPWVYSNEVVMDAEARDVAPGSLVTLVTSGGEPLGVATFNPKTLIVARLFARDAGVTVDEGLLARRLGAALDLRRRLYEAPYYRLVHAEADGLPGLVVDRYGDVLAVQLNTAGMERLWPALEGALDAVVSPRAVVLRNDAAARTLEELETYVKVVKGEIEGPVRLEENGVVFFADLRAGQKTGWFYDQRDNRAAVAALARGCRVLDLYSFTGGFAVQMAVAGAASVLGIDRSGAGLDLAGRAAAENGVGDICTFRRGQVFPTLERAAAEGTRYDLVVADPPAFVKSRKDLPAGIKGYRKLARLTASVVTPGGLLFLASCSHHVDAVRFAEEIGRGLIAARREGRILRAAGAGPDHPVHPLLPESGYLKSMLLQLD